MPSETTTTTFDKTSSFHESTKSLDVAEQSAVLGHSSIDLCDPEARRVLERKLLRKLDVRLSVVLIMCSLIYVDRSNIAAARIRGMEEDLHLHGAQFATLLSTFYIGLIAMQIPLNMLYNHTGRSYCISVAMMIWGVLAIVMGLTTSFVGALFIRIAFGCVEAAFLPGTMFLLTKWYKREELGVRAGFLGGAITVGSACGSLVAVAVLNTMNGTLGRPAWRWLFFLEGTVMVFVSACAIFILPDFPANTRWLSDEERRLAIMRMGEDAGVGDEDETEVGGVAAGLRMAVRDWRVWWLTVAVLCCNVAITFSSYLPTLTATMGFNSTVTLLLCAPPNIFAGISAVFISRHSDKTRERFYHTLIPMLCAVAGFALALSTMNTVARYCSIFLMTQIGSTSIILTNWISHSFLRPPSKRAVVLAIVNGFSQLGLLAGSYAWPTAWGPSYRKSFGICIATSGCTMLMCYVFREHLVHLNRKLDEGEEEKGAERKGFRYML